MAVIPRTRAGLVKFRPVESGARVAVVAPASPFDPDAFEAGLAELKRIGLEPVVDARVFATHPIVAGPADVRAAVIAEALARPDIQAVIAIRGGYGSAEILPYLDAAVFRRSRKAVVGYSDITALHAFLNCHVRLTSVHGAMVDGRLSKGADAYDVGSFLNSLSRDPDRRTVARGARNHPGR